jgi:integrase
MGAGEITRFLNALAVENKVAASTQNQALSALLFLYRVVLEQDLPWLDELVRAKRPQRLPVVLTREEIRAVLDRLQGVPLLMVLLLHGAGLRLLECARLRTKDVDFATNQIVVRTGKGDKDRVTMLPASVKPRLARHLDGVRRQHQRDIERGAGWVELPDALGRKYSGASGVGVAVGLPGDPDLRRSGDRAAAAAPPARVRAAARGQGRGRPGGHRQAGQLPHLPAFLRDPPAGGPPRHPHGSGTAGP